MDKALIILCCRIFNYGAFVRVSGHLKVCCRSEGFIYSEIYLVCLLCKNGFFVTLRYPDLKLAPRYARCPCICPCEPR